MLRRYGTLHVYCKSILRVQAALYVAGVGSRCAGCATALNPLRVPCVELHHAMAVSFVQRLETVAPPAVQQLSWLEVCGWVLWLVCVNQVVPGTGNRRHPASRGYLRSILIGNLVVN